MRAPAPTRTVKLTPAGNVFGPLPTGTNGAVRLDVRLGNDLPTFAVLDNEAAITAANFSVV